MNVDRWGVYASYKPNKTQFFFTTLSRQEAGKRIIGLPADLPTLLNHCRNGPAVKLNHRSPWLANAAAITALQTVHRVDVPSTMHNAGGRADLIAEYG